MNNLPNNKGFTLLEMMIASALVIMGVVGAFGVLQKAISTTAVNITRLKAAYLAQEGIEIIRNIRDSNWLEDPVGNFDDGIQPGSHHNLDYRSTVFPDTINCLSTEEFLKFNELNGFYECSSVSDSNFIRRVVNVDSSVSDKLKVKSTVTWEDHGQNHSITVEDVLYDWQVF